jgi:signal transduction histidine kinase
MFTPTPKGRPLIVLIAFAAMCLAAVALHGAVRWYDHPFAGVLVGPGYEISSIGLPTWDGFEKGLRFPDRVVSVDGVELGTSGSPASIRRWDEAVERGAREGRSIVHARVDTHEGTREVDLQIGRLDTSVWWLYGGGTILIGLLYVLAGLAAMIASPRGRLARTSAKTSIVCALYLFTFFDVQTTRTLVPLFYLAFAWIPFALVALALRLPEDARILKRFPRLVPLLDVAGILLAVARIGGDLVGRPLKNAGQICSVLLMTGMLFFAVTLVVRFVRSRGEHRDVMRALAYAMVPPHALLFVGIALALMNPRGSTVAFFAIPAFALVPVSIGVAFIRHDIWGSRALLSRMVTRSIVAGVACLLAIGAGAAFAASLGAPFGVALIAAAASGIFAAIAVSTASGVVDRTFFPARASYKPTIEQLSEELTSLTATEEVASAVERTVRRWLACERVEFLENDHEPHREVAESGTMPVAKAQDDLELPVAFGGRTLGVLRVGRKKGGALFTSDDVDLLRTIANQAALAFAHAHSYAELEQRRQQQAAAWQQERLALIETVAAEIAHEVRYPINFFRSVFQRGPQDGKLDAEEIEIGCEEVERLERLVSGLRRLTSSRFERRPVTLTELAARTEMLLRDVLAGRRLEVDMPDGIVILCNPDQVTQILVNLVSNALDATSARDRLGLCCYLTDGGAELVIWDTGPGFEADPSQLFAPWFTTKPRGTGLGLAITHRFVRAHGWTIDAVRDLGVTRFTIYIRRDDITEAPTRRPAAEVA